AAQLYADGLHLIPHRNGTVAVGSTSEKEFDRPDTTDDLLEETIAKARALVPAMADAPVLERWAGVRPRAKSRAPLLGPWPGRGGHFVANGGFKIGFGMAPKCAEVLVDLVLNGTDAIPEAFRTAPNS
ncbi:MAG: FAD-dependent oxidoreductase, partial [Pseudomonadota bacterium]